MTAHDAIRRVIIIDAMGPTSREQHRSQQPLATWNDRDRIAVHRALPPSERLRLAIEASRAALRFARGRRVDGR